ncbi:MAG: hypothetical protein GY795_26165 [Desulfobacterales bacterium]|nr:hypothetical protein [Desulfobacterales bacterium]
MQMKLCVPTNWDDELLNFINRLNQENNTYSKVYEIFGGLPVSIFGGGRPGMTLPNVDLDIMQKHIALAKSFGLKFNYLLNSSCLNNLEYDKTFINKFLQLFEWIYNNEIDMVTISIPFLMEIIKYHYPSIKVNVSTICHVDSVNKLHLFEKHNDIDRITLSFFINRNFYALKKMRSHAESKMEILANDSCLLECHNRMYHYNLCSHGSQVMTENASGGFFVDYPFINCVLARLKEPVQIIKSPWIRPEDSYIYEEMGIEYLKLSGRIKSTEWLKQCIFAYAKRNFEGNVYRVIDKQNLISSEFEYLTDENEHLIPPSIYVDNGKLNNFLETIISKKVNCYYDCDSCNLCKTFARKAVSFDKNEAEKYIQTLMNIKNRLSSFDFTKKKYYDGLINNWKLKDKVV